LFYEWDESTCMAIRQATAEACEAHETSSRIKSALGEELPDHVKAAVRAFDYMLVSRSAEADKVDAAYAPMMEFTSGDSYPEKLGEASEKTLQAWSDVFELFAESDAVAARVGDLLWLRHFGPESHAAGRSAQFALRRLAQSEALHSMPRADCLVRALDIAYELGDAALAQDTVREMVTAAGASLAAAGWEPGVSLGLIERLVRSAKRQRPPELSDLLKLAGQSFAVDPFVFQNVLELRLELVGGDRTSRQAIVSEGLAAWEREADSAEGLVAQTYLRRAVELARREGLNDEAERLLLKVQSSDQASLDLQRVEATVQLPRDEVQRYVDSFSLGDDRRIWLLRLASHCPVNSDREAVATEVREAMAQHPLGFIFPRVIVNTEGLPLKDVVGEVAHFNQAMIEAEGRNIGIWGLFVGDILDDLVTKGLSRGAFESFLAEGVVDPVEVDGFGRAFEHYAARRFEEAALICLPRLEAIVRRVSRTLGIVVYREPGNAGHALGGYKGLGEMLRALEAQVPGGHRRYLELLLSDPMGLSLRNLFLHGLTLNVSRTEAALVLHASLVLATWRLEHAGHGGADEGAP